VNRRVTAAIHAKRVREGESLTERAVKPACEKLSGTGTSMESRCPALEGKRGQNHLILATSVVPRYKSSLDGGGFFAGERGN